MFTDTPVTADFTPDAAAAAWDAVVMSVCHLIDDEIRYGAPADFTPMITARVSALTSLAQTDHPCRRGTWVLDLRDTIAPRLHTFADALPRAERVTVQLATGELTLALGDLPLAMTD